jgi:hypothetical protein
MEERFEVELDPIQSAAAAGTGPGGAPVDHTAEVPAIAALERRGFTHRFVAEGDRLRVSGTERSVRPEDVRILDYYRFEGTSDPDDMSVVYALETRDGVRGVLVDAFGSYADPEVGALLDRMRLQRPHGRTRRRPVMVVASIVGGLAVGLVGLAAVWAAAGRQRRAGAPRGRRAA